jgi:muconate cycloisomerase
VASAHVFAGFPHLDWGTELFGPLLITEEILETPLRYADFELEIPSGPGLGVTLDEDRLSHFRRDGARRVHAAGASPTTSPTAVGV